MQNNKYITRLFCLLILLSYSTISIAVPAKPTPITVTQPDGSTLSIIIRGDEKFHYRTTIDGYLIQKANDELYYYVKTNGDNELTISNIRVRDVELRTTEENSFLKNISKETVFEKNRDKSASILRNALLETENQNGITTFPTTGTPRTLIILVEFNDNSFSSSDAHADFSNLLNMSGYSYNGATGSAKDFFVENSMGAFNPQFDVYGPVKLPQDMAYYGENNLYGYDSRPEDMIIHACEILDDQIDFNDYDEDNDGFIDNVFIFFAGYGEAESDRPNTIWPHQSGVLHGGNKEVFFDGVQLNKYACTNEIIYGTDAMCGIGTFCHEFSHVLGLPDLYATNGEPDVFSPWTWSILDMGSYSNDGNTPPYYTAYERYCLGWLELEELDAPRNITLNDLSQNAGYIIKTPETYEYFVLENRQQQGWDTYIPGHGMIIWHIDYNAAIWSSNTVNNNPRRQRVDIEEADGIASLETLTGDPFPGTAGVTSFTDDTNPSMKTWANLGLEKPITDITETDGIIRFRFMGGAGFDGVPLSYPATDISHTQFTAHWSEVEGATRYTISVYEELESGIKYVLNYKAKELDNVTSFVVDNLEPGKTYKYKVKAGDFFANGDFSDETEVNMPEPTFEYYYPVATQATDINKNSFTATWNSLQEATGYHIDIYRKIETEADHTQTVDFTGRIEALPDGWTTSCVSTNSAGGFYGNSAPALMFNDNMQYLESAVYDMPIRTLRFWHRASASASDASLLIERYDGQEWEDAFTVSQVTSQTGGETIYITDDILTNSYAVRIRFVREAQGTLSIDDVEIGYGNPMHIEYVGNYEGFDVGNTLLFEAVGLTENTEYRYKIKAFNGSLFSRESNEIRVVTTSESSIPHQPKSTVSVFAIDNTLQIKSDKNIGNVHIYNISGILVYSSDVNTNEAKINLSLNPGIYFVKVENQSFKIVL